MTSPHRPPAAPARVPEGGALLLLVRHGQVESAHRGTLYGGAEVPLSEAGLRESLALAARLAGQELAAVHTSPLARTRVLAEAVAAQARVPLVIEQDLIELGRGCWTHRLKEDIERDFPGALQRYAEDPEHGNAPDGERESALRARVFAALDRIATAHAGQRVLVVAHAHVIRVAMARALGWSAPESLRHFVPYLGTVELALAPPEPGTVLSAPVPVQP